MDEIIKEVQDINEWIDHCHKRVDLQDYDTLMDLGITIGNYLRKLTIISLNTMTEDEASRNEDTFELHEAVIVGHLVRIYKLFDQLVYFVSENKGEISQIFSRLMFETFATMKYLIIKGNSSIDNYIKVSFKSTINQYVYIKEVESKKELVDIERRIIQKIENRIKKVGLDITDLTSNKNWKLDGLSFKGIIDYLKNHDSSPSLWGLSYDFMYGNSSTFIHGLWYDIELNHLMYSNGRYSPKLSYDAVDPRYILSDCFIPVMACIDYLKWRKSDPNNILIRVFEKIGGLLVHLNEIDEIRIEKKREGAT
ncbi:MAG: DUF5677 domain-containing protein [Bacteroidota bacterium]|jgi:hypothetical protein